MDDRTVNDYENNKIGVIDIGIIIENVIRGFMQLWWIFLILISVYSSYCFFQAKRSYSPYYKTSTTFVINMNQAGTYSGSYYNTATADQMAKSFPYILNSGILQKVVAADLGLDYVPGSISAVAMEGYNLFELSVTGSDPQQIYDVLQSVIKNYPSVAEYVIGDTQLHILDETGVPTEAENQPDFMPAAKAGAKKMMALCFVILAIYAMTRNTIRKEDDLKKRLNIKCLGSIPLARFKRRSSSEKDAVLINNKKIPQMFLEATRTLRMRVLKECRENNSKTILVTSSMPGEGKSTVTVNLALSLAQKDFKVVLIDGDLRHPSLAKTLGMTREDYKHGFHDVIMEHVSLSDALVPYKDTSVSMLLGADAVESTERVLSKAMTKKVIEEAAEMADFVIIDTPPTGMLADASILSHYVDSALFVVRQDAVRTDRVIEAVQNLSETGVHMIGCVLNGVQAGLTGYGSSYGKYGRSGYGYGQKRKRFGEKETSEEVDE